MSKQEPRPKQDVNPTQEGSVSEQPAPESPVTIPPAMADTAAPTVTIMAAGGCGINMLRLLDQRHKYDITRQRFDTSMSNVREGEDIIQLAQGDGSGKVRTENAEIIQKRLVGYTDEQLGISDINIIVYSLAGGKELLFSAV